MGLPKVDELAKGGIGKVNDFFSDNWLLIIIGGIAVILLGWFLMMAHLFS